MSIKGWQPIKEYFKGNYDWVLVKYYDKDFASIPTVAEFNKQLDLDYVDENFIPKQVVIDEINEINKKYEDSKNENGENPYFYPNFTIKTLQKILEGEK